MNDLREIFLEGKDLLKVYGPTTAVNHLDINVYQGEVLALVGGNGAGKSTFKGNPGGASGTVLMQESDSIRKFLY